MAKKVKTEIKLQIPAGQANPAPPVGPALGAHGVNIKDFCQQFNAETQSQNGMLIPVIITVYEDRSFSFIKKSPPASTLIKQKAKLKSGSKKPGLEIAGLIKKEALEEIAEIKKEDMNGLSLEGRVNTLMGTARSMGIEVQE